LFICDSGIFPARDGKRQRNLALVTAAKTKYKIDYLILGNILDFEVSKTYASTNLRFLFLPLPENPKLLKKLGLSFKANPIIQKLVAELLSKNMYDRILCRYASSAKDLPLVNNLIIDVDDDYGELIASKIRSEKTIFRKIRFWQIGILNTFFYKKILKTARSLILVKPQDLDYRTRLLPNLPFQSIFSNKERIFTSPTTNSLLFVGKLSYAPNAEGISWFLKEIWPKLRFIDNSIKLTIVSVVEPQEVLYNLIKSSDGVTLKINVADLESEYRSHVLCIVPIFFGGGTNVKLTEALYNYRRVISTTFGVRGFEQLENSNLLVSVKNDAEWIDSILNFSKTTYSKEDFAFVEDSFSFEKWTNNLISILNED
jgi:hypothetical protein